MTLHPVLAAVTDRVRIRSAASRAIYLSRLERARAKGPIRRLEVRAAMPAGAAPGSIVDAPAGALLEIDEVAYIGLRDYRARLKEDERLRPERPLPARNPSFRLLYGSEFAFERFKLVVIARNLAGWGNLCEFITVARNTEAPKGAYRVAWDHEALAKLGDCEVLFVPRRVHGPAVDTALLCTEVADARAIWGNSLWLTVERHGDIDQDFTGKRDLDLFQGRKLHRIGHRQHHDVGVLGGCEVAGALRVIGTDAPIDRGGGGLRPFR